MRERDPAEDPAITADRLKERIYVTFAALAVVLTLRGHAAETDATSALLTVVITVAGTLLAVFVADLVSHVLAHETLPTRAELTVMARVTFGAAGAVAVPVVFLALGALGVWTLSTSLTASTIALIVALVIIARAAVRRLKLSRLWKWVFLLAEAALGLAVIGLELLAHSL